MTKNCHRDKEPGFNQRQVHLNSVHLYLQIGTIPALASDMNELYEIARKSKGRWKNEGK